MPQRTETTRLWLIWNRKDCHGQDGKSIALSGNHASDMAIGLAIALYDLQGGSTLPVLPTQAGDYGTITLGSTRSQRKQEHTREGYFCGPEASEIMTLKRSIRNNRVTELTCIRSSLCLTTVPTTCMSLPDAVFVVLILISCPCSFHAFAAKTTFSDCECSFGSVLRLDYLLMCPRRSPVSWVRRVARYSVEDASCLRGLYQRGSAGSDDDDRSVILNDDSTNPYTSSGPKNQLRAYRHDTKVSYQVLRSLCLGRS